MKCEHTFTLSTLDVRRSRGEYGAAFFKCDICGYCYHKYSKHTWWGKDIGEPYFYPINGPEGQAGEV